MRHAVATLIIGILFLLAWWFWERDDAKERAALKTTEVLIEAEETPDRGPQAAYRAPPTADRAPRPAPRSLEGTDVDGFFRIDASGNFVPDANAISLFDYFLSTEGEITLAEIRRLVEAEAKRQLPSDQVAHAMSLFDQYMRYRSDAMALSERFDRSELGAHYEALVELQQEIFGTETAKSLFGEANLLAENAIARHELARNDSLSPEEKRTQLAALDAKLPESTQRTRQRINRPQQVASVVEQMRADGLSDEDVFAYRADEFGAAAAERLAALDEERAAWSARLNAYRKDRDEVLARDLSESVQAQAIQALREQHFAGTEVTRVRVLDQMDNEH